MRLVYCIAGTYNSGGMERVLANKANYLVCAGYDISIVTTEQKGRASFFKFDDRINFYDLSVNYEENNGSSFWDKFINYPRKQMLHKKRLSALLKKIQPDIVVSMFCNEAGFLTRINDGSKKVLEVHFSRYKRLQYARKGLWRLADVIRSYNDLNIVKRYDKFVVLTDEDMTYWGSLPNMTVIPNARSFTFEEPAKLLSKNAIAVGRFNYQKGYDRLVRAWKIVVDNIPEAELTIYGDGELKPDIQSIIGNLGLDSNVYLKRADTNIKDVYRNASLLVLSSHYEGLPMVLLEAQAAGLPIVSFACKCGPRDIINDGCSGYLVDNGDINALADRIIDVLNNDTLRRQMGSNAYINSSNYDEALIMRKWVDLFNSIK